MNATNALLQGYSFPKTLENDAIGAFFGYDKQRIIHEKILQGDYRSLILLIPTYLENGERVSYDKTNTVSMIDHISRLALPTWKQKVVDILRKNKDREYFLRTMGQLSLYFSQSQYLLFSKEELLNLFRDGFSLEFLGR